MYHIIDSITIDPFQFIMCKTTKTWKYRVMDGRDECFREFMIEEGLNIVES